jgi:hypothetical protein
MIFHLGTFLYFYILLEGSDHSCAGAREGCGLDIAIKLEHAVSFFTKWMIGGWWISELTRYIEDRRPVSRVLKASTISRHLRY